MSTAKLTARTPRQMAPRCAAIPGLMHARRDLNNTRGELAHIVDLAREEGDLVPKSEKDRKPDAVANLWFLRAAHEFGIVANDGGNKGEGQKTGAVFFTEQLLPLVKNIVQKFISDGGIGLLRMDDGGMLAARQDRPGPAILAPEALRINALWYNAMELTSQALAHRAKSGSGGKDSSAHHFDKLASRMRRSFAKAFWCDEHASICTPHARLQTKHGRHSDPDQLLVTMLPASPMPLTKQRQILGRFINGSLGEVGVLVDHPEHGIVESPLHRAWLARGVAVEDRARAMKLAEPLKGLWELARKNSAHAFYKGGKAVAGTKADPLTSAELLWTLEMLFGTSG